MSRTFSFDRRVLMCSSCGAPGEVPIQGGQQTCGSCGHVESLPPRPTYESLAKKGRAPVPENERLSRLRAQDGKPLLPPKSIATLFGPGGVIPDWKLDEAMSVYLTACKNAKSTGDFGAAEQVHFLTLALGNRFKKMNQDEERRALFETSLEALTLPRLRQMMLCYLSRAAAVEGDLSSAAKWMQPCDPSSDELQADSAYRLTQATLDTAHRNWSGVLDVLGPQHNQIPIADFMDSLAVVLRANAQERLGNVEGAVAELQVYMGEGSASGRAAIKSIIAALETWNVCELSYAQAEAQYTQKAAQKAASVASGGIGGLFLPLGGALLIGGLVGVYFLITGTGQGGLVLMGIPGIILFVIGLNSRRSAKKAAYIRAHGIQGTATLVSASPTGTRINNVPQYALTMSIQLAGKEPYQGVTKLLVNPGSLPMLTPGFQAAVRVHPENPQDFILEFD